MNRFKFTKKIDSDESNKVLITLSPVIADKFIELLKEHFTIQFIEGEINTLASGQIELKFELNDEDASILKTAFIKAYVLESGYQTNN